MQVHKHRGEVHRHMGEEVLRCRGLDCTCAGVQGCRGSDVQRGTGKMCIVQRFRSAGAVVQRGVEVHRCRGACAYEVLRCTGAWCVVVLRC